MKNPNARPASSKSPISSERLWPADKVERWLTARLIPNARNARLHTDADIDAIAKSMERFGFTNPVLVDESGVLIAGHGRVLAAEKRGYETVPVMVAQGWTDEEKRAYCIVDSQLAARATWDCDRLHAQLDSLNALGFNLGLLGFDPDALKELMAPPPNGGLTDPDQVPDPSDNPVTRIGDTWLLGPHHVHCGDSTTAEAVRAASGDLTPALMVTDPPYGVAYDPTWREGKDRRHTVRSKGKVLNDDRADWREAWDKFLGDVAYVWHSALQGGTVAESLRSCGFEIRAQIVWAKQHFTFSRGDYHWQHETCWYAVRKGASGRWAGDRKQTTVWEIPNNNSFGNPNHEKVWGHGTQKPVECMRRPIINNSQPGQVIYDPFLGTGTSIIAAEITGRICVGLELSPAYVDVIVKRYSAFTGQAAIHEASGKTFDEVAAQRGINCNPSSAGSPSSTKGES